MNKSLVIACSPLPIGVAWPQQGVPIVSLAAATAKSGSTFGAILGVRQVADGTVLVNDAGRHQIRLFDSPLALSTIVSDSAPGTSTSYGQYATPLGRSIAAFGKGGVVLLLSGDRATGFYLERTNFDAKRK